MTASHGLDTLPHCHTQRRGLLNVACLAYALPTAMHLVMPHACTLSRLRGSMPSGALRPLLGQKVLKCTMATHA